MIFKKNPNSNWLNKFYFRWYLKQLLVRLLQKPQRIVPSLVSRQKSKLSVQSVSHSGNNRIYNHDYVLNIVDVILELVDYSIPSPLFKRSFTTFDIRWFISILHWWIETEPRCRNWKCPNFLMIIIYYKLNINIRWRLLRSWLAKELLINCKDCCDIDKICKIAFGASKRKVEELLHKQIQELWNIEHITSLGAWT